jgi:hypothetical protein
MIIIATFARWPRAPPHRPDQPRGRRLDPAWPGPHSGRCNRASANGPSCARRRHLRSAALVPPPFQDRSCELATRPIDGADRSGISLGDDEHPGSMGGECPAASPAAHDAGQQFDPHGARVIELRHPPRAAVSPARDGIGSSSVVGRGPTSGRRSANALLGDASGRTPPRRCAMLPASRCGAYCGARCARPAAAQRRYRPETGDLGTVLRLARSPRLRVVA